MERTDLMSEGINPEAGRTKFGELDSGTQASHVAGFDVLDSLAGHTTGPAMSQGTKQAVANDMNQDSNLRLKTTGGNLSGSGGGALGDKSADARIMQHMDQPTGSGDTVSGRVGDRAARINDSIQSMDSVPQGIKNTADQVLPKEDV